jgi:hypothetical protein
MLIKGTALIRECLAKNETLNVRFDAISCTELEQAMALKQLRGQPDSLN